VDPFHLAVGKRVADELELLIADHRELLGDPHHGTVEFADHPGVPVQAQFGNVPLIAAQLHQLFQPGFQTPQPDPDAVVGGLLQRLLVHQVADGFRGQAAGQRVEQAEGEILTAIGEAIPTLAREPPAIARPARPLRGRCGFHQAGFLKAAEMAPHHLHRHRELVRKFGGGGLAAAEQQFESAFPGGGGIRQWARLQWARLRGRQGA